MALFKPFMGSRTSLDTQEKHAGYAYFCTDDGSFHIDYIDANGVLQRKQINAKNAETFNAHTVDEFLLETDIDLVLAQAKESGEFDGADGVSATHSWNGTTLTITSASGTSSVNLKGEKGEQGEKGADGAKGDQGLKGDTGEAGYTPVRGTDYWTDADKAEIKSYVDEAILGGAW